MAELVPTSLADHIVRMHRELATQGAVYDLPRSQWFVPDASGPDLSVRFHGETAGNPSGPAAGPHGQMAQNIVLSYLAGGRILELKTVQVNDRLVIPRPCIDATNVGYNVEWSQELRLQQSLREYVHGAMLVHIVRSGGFFEDAGLTGPSGDVIYDMSVGYDLAGIQSPSVREFISGMLDASALVDELRVQIPAAYRHLRDLDYPTRLSRSITLSTFHGCPANEVQRIGEHLIGEHGVNLIVKMNPPMLGKDRLEYLLHDVMGYDEIRVHQPAYTSGLLMQEAIEIVNRLDALAKTRGLRCGAKFSNTLEVVNHRDFFPQGNEVMYLSGPPLFVITTALMAAFRERVSPDVPISFSAGVDQKNFADVVACGIAPVTTCTDLLRPGGYARLPKYMHALAADMRKLGADDIDAYVLARCEDPDVADPIEAGARNTSRLAESAGADMRYRRERNSLVPKRIQSKLVIFDCLTCDKCIPVCPNDANFTYPLAEQNFTYHDLCINADGTIQPATEAKTFVTQRGMQIANFADYCNECGNCDTFCPEYGGPFIEKPTFFSTLEQFKSFPKHDGFCVRAENGIERIVGRIRGALYTLRVDHKRNELTFGDGVTTTVFDTNHQPQRATLNHEASTPRTPHTVDLHIYHTLRLLLEGMLDLTRINPINATLA